MTALKAETRAYLPEVGPPALRYETKKPVKTGFLPPLVMTDKSESTDDASTTNAMHSVDMGSWAYLPSSSIYQDILNMAVTAIANNANPGAVVTNSAGGNTPLGPDPLVPSTSPDQIVTPQMLVQFFKPGTPGRGAAPVFFVPPITINNNSQSGTKSSATYKVVP